MNFCIRCDDVNYFTKPKELNYSFEACWSKCPITYSIVPFHGHTKSGAIPNKKNEKDTLHPLDKNKELIAFLKKQIESGKAEIMLHGFSHKNHENGYEFDGGKDLTEKIYKGKLYLESLFDIELHNFVPPHNAISNEGLKAVIKNNLNLVSSGVFRPAFTPTIRGLFNAVKIFLLKIIHRRSYPYSMDFGTHKSLGCYSLTPSTNVSEMKRSIDYVHQMQGTFVCATHYWEFEKVDPNGNMTLKEKFSEVWNYVQSKDNVDFTGISSLLK